MENINFILETAILRIPPSLRNPCQSFGLDETESKGYYPYKFPNESNYNYVGVVPYDYNRKEDQSEICKQYPKDYIWNLKIETERYQIKHQVSQYNIIFRKLIFDDYKCDIINSLPSQTQKILSPQDCNRELCKIIERICI